MNHTKKHGLYGTKFYRTYMGINTRCNRENHVHYKCYGGRGIKSMWRSFLDFRNDMYESYLAHTKIFGEVDTQIDRIDVNSDYSKTNCRWVTRKQQSRNRRDTVYLTYKGVTKSAMDWADDYGMPIETLKTRLRMWDGNVMKALETVVSLSSHERKLPTHA